MLTLQYLCIVCLMSNKKSSWYLKKMWSFLKLNNDLVIEITDAVSKNN